MLKDKEALVHESGVTYYEIALKAAEEGVEDIKLRLFENDSNARLDFETFDEYKIRRQYMNEFSKQKKKGQMAWPSGQYGTVTRERAIEVMEAIQKQDEDN